jgi:hypothetical protein
MFIAGGYEEETTIPRTTTIVMIAVNQSITPKPAIAGR